MVVVEHLRKTYGTTRAADDISFAVNEGEIFGIIGPNGAGKTTTVECISGLRPPDSGTVRVLGLDPTTDRSRLRELVGVQLQEGALPPAITVGEALELFASFYERPGDVGDLLGALGLAAKRKTRFRHLSGGLKQRLSIALALVGRPKVAILDELTTGLDPQARRETWNLIEEVRDRGVTVLLVTHFMDEAERLCDRVALINHGRLQALDTPLSLARREGGGSHLRFVPSATFTDELLTSVPEVRSVVHEGHHVLVTGEGDLVAPVFRALDRAGVQVRDVQVRTGTLDDAFVRMTHEPAPSVKEPPPP